MVRQAISLLCLWCLPSLGATLPPKTLAECFKAAVAKSETVADSEEDIRQAEERYRQAWGSIFPTLSGVGSYQIQEGAGSGTVGSVSPSTQPLVKVTLTQPLFRGLREWYGLKQTKLLTTASREAKRQAMKQLYLDTASVFYTVLSLEKEAANRRTETEDVEKRIKELQGRVRIGRSRRTEVLTVESSLASLKAQLALSTGQMLAARGALAFHTGLPAATPLKDSEPLPTSLPPLEKLRAGRDRRPDVKAAEVSLEAAGENIGVQRGAHFPSLDVTGNYYLKRSGFLENVHWDVRAELTIPIFNGGVISSRVAEAESQRTQGELALQRAKRAAEQEIQSLHQTLAADLAQLEALTRAVELSKKNFEEQTKEYRYGLVNNLEVLQALTSYEDAQRNLDRARFTAKLDQLKLRAAAEDVAMEN